MPRAEVRLRGRRASGLTLLEMVVAIGIFSVIAVIVFAALSSSLESETRLRAHHERLAALVRTVTALERDLRHAVARGVRDGQGDAEPPLWAWPADPPAPGELLRLTVAQPGDGVPVEAGLVRVAWRIDDGRLYRVTWRVLDRAQDSVEDGRRMLADVEDVELRLLVYDRQSGLGATAEWSDPARLPDGLSVTVHMRDGGIVQRVLEVANGSP